MNNSKSPYLLSKGKYPSNKELFAILCVSGSKNQAFSPQLEKLILSDTEQLLSTSSITSVFLGLHPIASGISSRGSFPSGANHQVDGSVTSHSFFQERSEVSRTYYRCPLSCKRSFYFLSIYFFAITPLLPSRLNRPLFKTREMDFFFFMEELRAEMKWNKLWDSNVPFSLFHYLPNGFVYLVNICNDMGWRKFCKAIERKLGGR